MERERLIEAEWQHGADEGGNGLYYAGLKVFGNNRTGLLVDVTKVLTERHIDINAVHSTTSKRGIDISTIHSKTNKQGIATIEVAFCVKSRGELISLIEKIRQVESVLDIERTTG